MVCVCGLGDRNPKSKGQRPSDASPPFVSPSRPVNPLERDLGLPPEIFVRSDVAKIAPLTFKVVARRCVAKVETT